MLMTDHEEEWEPGDIVGPDDDEMIALGHIGKIIDSNRTRTIWTCKICGYTDDFTKDLRMVG